MTRDQLIAKRKAKKRRRRIAAATAVAAVGLLIFGGIGVVRNEVGRPPGDLGTEELTEVEGIVSMDSEREGMFIDPDIPVPQ